MRFPSLDINACSLDTTVIVEQGSDFDVDLESEVTISLGEDYTLEAEVSIPEEEIATVVWTPGEFLDCDSCLTVTASPDRDIMYSVEVTDTNGCTGQASVAFTVKEELTIFIPNTFSPNGDGVNDYFTVYTNTSGTRINSLRIFDRWGGQVFGRDNFDPNDPQLGWDGMFKGQYVNPGVFVYVAEVRFSNGFIEIYKGDVTVIR